MIANWRSMNEDERKELLAFVRPKGQWIAVEYDKHFDGGLILTFRGFRCPKCGYERHRKRGKSKFCEECGTDLRENVIISEKEVSDHG